MTPAGGWLLAAGLLLVSPAAGAVLCPAEADRFPAFAGELRLPPADRAFETAEADDGRALAGFLEETTGLTVYLQLAVRQAEPAVDPGCTGNLVSVESGEILVRFDDLLVAVGDLATGAPHALCQPDEEGFRLRGFFFVEPPPPVASLLSYRLRPVAVDPLSANRSVACLSGKRS
ncbi:MAG TPA: hypothetical protein ENJ38_08630 [Rhodospirillales bacterium]|nr:hypothetical protein [Rhodospirillales bacterium]